ARASPRTSPRGGRSSKPAVRGLALRPATRRSPSTTRRPWAGITSKPQHHVLHRRHSRRRAETRLNARAVVAWSVTCIVIVLSTSNPAYKATVLAAALCALAAGVGLRRLRGLLMGVLLIALFAVALNFLSAHLGTSVLFALPSQIPAIGGPYTLEALAFGATGGLPVAAAIISPAPFSLLLASHEVMDALPSALSRTGAAIAASLNLVPSVAA